MPNPDLETNSCDDYDSILRHQGFSAIIKKKNEGNAPKCANKTCSFGGMLARSSQFNIKTLVCAQGHCWHENCFIVSDNSNQADLSCIYCNTKEN
jgi:hypothetical protein